MAETTTEMRTTYGGLSSLGLGLLIGAIGVAILLTIVIATCLVVFCSRSKKKGPKRKDDEEKMVSMQTARTVGGQPMQQVIMKGQRNGNMDKHSSPNVPLQTMDPETNTVRYDTAHSSIRIAEVDSPGKVESPEPDIDSGTGDSPHRATVFVHNDGDDRDERDSQPSKRSSDSGANSNEPKEGADNAAYSSDEGEIPFTSSYPIPPPPPVTDPPPPTPGIPVTDLDEGETIIVPPPPPPPDHAIYAEINKNRPSSSKMRSTYRDAAEIQIIEKEKF